MQKYTYTFVERADTETYAVTGTLPQRGDRVYLSPAMVAACLSIMSIVGWTEFRVAAVDRLLETNGERVRVVLERPPAVPSQIEEQHADVEDDACPFEPTGEVAAVDSQTTSSDPLEDLRRYAELVKLTVHTPSDSHVQVRKGGKVVLDWWPSTHKTRTGNKRGPDCMTAGEVVEFLKSL